MEIQPLFEGNYFHIFNRGVNSADIFKEEKNYYYFLKQYEFYCSDVFETLAYALLKNHFHLLVYIRENVFVPKITGGGLLRLNASKQLSHFFNSYAQAFNKMYGRTGPLFESPFERRLIDDEQYITSVIYYCHYNPQMHGFVTDFRNWKFSSYHAILAEHHSFLATEKVISWFGNKAAFEKAHELNKPEKDYSKYKIE